MKNYTEALYNEAKKAPGCTFGYIGNFESWGDDRELRIWRGSKTIWRRSANEMNMDHYNEAIQVLEKIKLLN